MRLSRDEGEEKGTDPSYVIGNIGYKCGALESPPMCRGSTEGQLLPKVTALELGWQGGHLTQHSQQAEQCIQQVMLPESAAI